jgi:hypothetical protein
MKKLKVLLGIITVFLFFVTSIHADGITIQSKGATTAQAAAIAANTLKDTNVPVATDPIWTSAGELVIGTGVGTAQKLSAGATTEILVGGGAADPVWTTANGTGAPVRTTSPTLVTPLLGTPTSGTLTNCTGLPTGGVTLSATAKILGRATAGAGVAEEIAVIGSGSVVLATSPSIATPTVTGAVTLTGGQIAFPATAVPSANANTLDDYQEGTFETTITCSTSGTMTLHADYDTLAFVKIGRLVTVTGVLLVDSVSSPLGYAVINSLPFAATAAAPYRAAGSLFCSDMEATATTSMQCRIVEGTTTIDIFHFTAGAQGGAAADFKAGANVYLSITYITD